MTTEKTYEACPICGRRSRRTDCLVCNQCKQKVVEPLEEKNAAALLDERFDDIIDPFEFVLERGQNTLEQKQTDLQEAEIKRDARRRELRQKAEHNVAAIISSNRKGNNNNRYSDSPTIRERSISMLFQRLKREDKIFKWAYALSQSIKSLTAHLAGIQKKREEYLSAQQSDTGTEVVKVA